VKLKYYLRGLGIGIIVTTVILMISFPGKEEKLTDEEIIARAKQLGMVMPEEDSPDGANASGDDGDAGNPANNADGASDQANDADDGETDLPQDPAGEDGSAGNPAEGMNADQPQSGGSGEEPQAGGNPGETGHINVGGTQNPEENAVNSYRLTISRGDVCRVICEDLAANGVVSDAEALREYLLDIGYASHISVGEYDIPYGLTNEEIADILKAGPIEEP
jgi:hypothetical protein